MRYTRWGTSIIDLVNENTKVLNNAAVKEVDFRNKKVTEEVEINENKSETSDM
jgi:hypothetical protein